MFKQSNNENREPNLEACRKDIDDAKCKKSNTEALRPTRADILNEREEPRFTKLMTEEDEPNLVKERTDKPDAAEQANTTEHLEHCETVAMPTTVNELPIRMKERNDKALPKAAKFTVEKQLPDRIWDRNDMVDPRWVKDIIDTPRDTLTLERSENELPSDVISRVDRSLANRERLRIESVEPRFVYDRIDRLDFSFTSEPLFPTEQDEPIRAYCRKLKEDATLIKFRMETVEENRE